MENEISYNPICLIYPGTYVPLIKEDALKEALERTHTGDSLFPPVNLSELPDSFKVEVAIPGINKEDFLVYSDGNVLSVSGLQKESVSQEKERFQIHEFNYECFDRHIILPGNADMQFATAEYKEGILRLMIPKSSNTGKNVHSRIVVY